MRRVMVWIMPLAERRHRERQDQIRRREAGRGWLPLINVHAAGHRGRSN